MTVWRRVNDSEMKCGESDDAFAGKSDRRTARSYRDAISVGARLAREGTLKAKNQSSSAFTDLGDSRKLRRLRLTLLR